MTYISGFRNIEMIFWVASGNSGKPLALRNWPFNQSSHFSMYRFCLSVHIAS